MTQKSHGWCWRSGSICRLKMWISWGARPTQRTPNWRPTHSTPDTNRWARHWGIPRGLTFSSTTPTRWSKSISIRDRPNSTLKVLRKGLSSTHILTPKSSNSSRGKPTRSAFRDEHGDYPRGVESTSRPNRRGCPGSNAGSRPDPDVGRIDQRLALRYRESRRRRRRRDHFQEHGFVLFPRDEQHDFAPQAGAGYRHDGRNQGGCSSGDSDRAERRIDDGVGDRPWELWCDERGIPISQRQDFLHSGRGGYRWSDRSRPEAYGWKPVWGSQQGVHHLRCRRERQGRAYLHSDRHRSGDDESSWFGVRFLHQAER